MADAGKIPGRVECSDYKEELNYCANGVARYRWLTDSRGVQTEVIDTNVPWIGHVTITSSSRFDVSDNQVCIDIRATDFWVMNYPTHVHGIPSAPPPPDKDEFIKVFKAGILKAGNIMCTTFFKKDGKLFQKAFIDGSPMIDGESIVRFFDKAPATCSTSKDVPIVGPLLIRTLLCCAPISLLAATLRPLHNPELLIVLKNCGRSL